MKHIFEKTTFLMIFAIISIGSISCDPQRPGRTEPTPPAQRWADWVSIQERIGRTVVDAAESRLWLAEHSDKISLPDKIGFMEQHFVMESPFIGIIITTDHSGKRRIVARQWPLPEPPKEPSFKDIYAETHTLLSHSESLNWLRRNGYNVSATGNGYRITRNSPGYKIDNSITGTGTIVQSVRDNSGNPVTLVYDGKSGNLCIAIPK